MSDGSRGKFFTAVTMIFAAISIGLIAAAIWSIASNTTRENESSRRHASQYAEDADRRIKADCLNREAAAMTECIRKILDTTNEEKRGEADLQAQLNMDRWAFWMLVVSTLSFPFTVVGAVYLFWNFQETRLTTAAAIRSANASDHALIEMKLTTKASQEAVEIARRGLVATHRPWINSHPFIHTDLVFKDGVATVTLSHKIENVGAGVAVDIFNANGQFLCAPKEYFQGRLQPLYDSQKARLNDHRVGRAGGSVLLVQPPGFYEDHPEFSFPVDATSTNFRPAVI